MFHMPKSPMLTKLFFNVFHINAIDFDDNDNDEDGKIDDVVCM